MRILLLSMALFVAGCGGASTTGGPCTTACDCSGGKPLSCATGEWTCNDSKVCEYKCQPTCGGGGVGTCAYPANCNAAAGYCSERTSCP